MKKVKEILQQYAAYNLWANTRLMDCILELPEEWHRRELASSFTSLYATLLHMWDAESIWWQRMKMQEVITPPSVQFNGDTRDVAHGILQRDKSWESWVAAASEPALEHVFHYQNTKKEQFKQPVYQVLLQVFNHATYHRGQLVTLLRQLGAQKIPATDFIVFSRTK